MAGRRVTESKDIIRAKLLFAQRRVRDAIDILSRYLTTEPRNNRQVRSAAEQLCIWGFQELEGRQWMVADSCFYHVRSIQNPQTRQLASKFHPLSIVGGHIAAAMGKWTADDLNETEAELSCVSWPTNDLAGLPRIAQELVKAYRDKAVIQLLYLDKRLRQLEQSDTDFSQFRTNLMRIWGGREHLATTASPLSLLQASFMQCLSALHGVLIQNDRSGVGELAAARRGFLSFGFNSRIRFADKLERHLIQFVDRVRARGNVTALSSSECNEWLWRFRSDTPLSESDHADLTNLRLRSIEKKLTKLNPTKIASQVFGRKKVRTDSPRPEKIRVGSKWFLLASFMR